MEKFKFVWVIVDIFIKISELIGGMRVFYVVIYIVMVLLLELVSNNVVVVIMYFIVVDLGDVLGVVFMWMSVVVMFGVSVGFILFYSY